MKKRNAINLIPACALLLSICGCINYEQDTSLNPDLSGRIEIHLFFDPRPMISEMFKKDTTNPKLSAAIGDMVEKASMKADVKIKEEDILESFNQEAIKNKSFKKIEKDGIQHFYFTVEFDDIRKLFQDKKVVSVVTDNRGSIAYTEYFKLLKDEKKEVKSDESSNEFLKGFYFKYQLHMPGDIVRANTGNIDKNTAVWELPLGAAMNDSDFKITATSKRRK